MLDHLPDSARLSAFQSAIRSGDSYIIEGLWEGPKALLAALSQTASQKNVLIITAAAREDRLQEDLKCFFKDTILDFPAWETLPTEQVLPSPDIIGERYDTLRKILNDGGKKIILCSLQSCLQRIITPKFLQSHSSSFTIGEEHSFEALQARLVKMGYQRKPIASDKGEFAIRGGILDIFPVSSADPVRIEFWGDKIESIRTFDPIGQKSIAKLEKIDISPALESEFLSSQTGLATLFDYLGEQTLVILDDLLALEDKYVSMGGSAAHSKVFMSFSEFLDRVKNLQKLFWIPKKVEELSDVKLLERPQAHLYSSRVEAYLIEFEIFQTSFQIKRWQHPFLPLGQYFSPEEDYDEESPAELYLDHISLFADSDLKLNILCATESDENYLKKRLQEEQIALPKATLFHREYLSSGFALNDTAWAIFPLAEITHRYQIRRQKLRSTYHTPPSELLELTPGDAVVHLQHGIGKYLGIEKKPNHLGIESEFLVIEYSEKAKLYVPLVQTHLISKYIGASEELPKLHTLYSSRWKSLKTKTEAAILGYAVELLKLYAEREVKGGTAFPEDSATTLLFEKDFPYVETEDQLAAISDIKKDMLAVKPMDRLVCGDVGYGKTEVAMRAAFKAVVDGQKQVAVLVPTTVLAMQHYETFVDRMRNFPITVAVLSRFKTPKEIAQTLKGIENGSVDIVIGTHRIISKDVKFKDLGMIIVDEEQRFGVKAKEHLKTIKSGAECLTLSATPIPRTLYMSLVGARDVSVISTPPQDRLPIKTIVCEDDESTITQALLRELSRDGQAYFIHNRVETIFQFADKLKKLLPQAKIVVAHGQMSADELDLVFHAFKQGHADILVATTIVENGIDIPNANTIIIDRADRFGMADLYQLRGRVGRWNRRAYCYFLTPKRKVLSEIAKKRLDALQLTSGYGGGMRVAMRDLEIRGAGDLLGIEQSGHISSVGFHLYCKLLKRTIDALQGKAPLTLSETKIEFPQDARLPEEYINETTLRMEIYQRLGEAGTLQEVADIYSELIDRFGKPPPSVQWLYHLTRIRVFAAQHHFTLVRQQQATLFVEQRKGDKVKTNTLLFMPSKDPADLEKKVIELLGKNK